MMRPDLRTLRRIGLCTAMLALGLGCCVAQAPAPAAGGEISGVVVSAKSGEALADAHMALTRSKDRKLIAETKSDAGGRFRFEGLPDGKYDLAAARHGYVAASFEQHGGGVSTAIVTGAGLVSTGLRFELEPQATIYGTVADDSGDPVPQARMSLYRKDNGQGTGKILRVAVTMADAAGKFEFAKLAPGSYYACAFGTPWYARPGHHRRGPQGDPASERRLAALDVAYAPTCYPNVTEASAAAAIPVGAGERVEVDIAMHPTPAMHLELQLPGIDGKRQSQPPQFSVDMFGSTEPLMTPVTFWANEGGRNANGPFTVEIDGIAAGQYTLEVPGVDGESERGMTVDASADNTAIDLAAAMTKTPIAGKVTVAGGGSLPAGVMVWLTPREGNQPSIGPVGDDGTFKLQQNVIPGMYEVTVSASVSWMGISSLSAKGGTLHGHMLKVGSDPVELILALSDSNANVNGQVTRDGRPKSGVFVVLAPVDLDAGHSMWRSNQSDSDGTFNFQHIAPGTYTAAAIEKGWTLDWSRPEVMAPYLAHGERVTVTQGAREVNLKDPLEAQPRDATANSAAAASQ